MVIHGENSWHKLCKEMPDKTEIKCFQRWNKLKSQQGNKRQKVEDDPNKVEPLISTWSKQEDAILKEKVLIYGTSNWVVIANHLPGRLGRQCRERWHNVLNPSIVRREWTREEDEFILAMQREIGQKWSAISKMGPLQGRTVAQIKNRYYQNLKNKDVSKIIYTSPSG